MRSKFVGRGRYRADKLTAEEIERLQGAPEGAADHLTKGNFYTCNACLSAQKEQRAALEQALLVASDLLLVALSHGHAVTFGRAPTATTQGRDRAAREEDTIDRGPWDVSIDLNAVARSIR